MPSRHVISQLLGAAIVSVAIAPQVVAGPCEPNWDPTVGTPGFNAWVLGLYVFDPAGAKTSVLPGLYAGGGFTTAGSLAASRIARWDGSAWSTLGSGIDSGNASVWAMCAYDEGNGRGPVLFVGGDFLQAGGQVVNRIARWDGSAWSSVGGGGNAEIRGAMVVFDDGSGPQLYVGGNMTMIGGVSVKYIARWNGTTWSDVGGGFDGPTPSIRALAIHDDGSGPALYAGGDFTTAGGAPANCVAKWNGRKWSPLGLGTSKLVRTLCVGDDGSGPALYAGGDFTTAGGAPVARIARWKDAQWSTLGSGMNATVRSIKMFDDGAGAGPQLHVSGDFATAGGVTVNGVTRWDGRQWHSLGSGMNNIVHALTVFDDGGGPALFTAGMFHAAMGTSVGFITRQVACPVPDAADLDHSGIVNGIDLALLLGQWTGSAMYAPCPPFRPADLNHDCRVNGLDLALLLGSWG